MANIAHIGARKFQTSGKLLVYQKFERSVILSSVEVSTEF